MGEEVEELNEVKEVKELMEKGAPEDRDALDRAKSTGSSACATGN
jgi:hypothetical protein